MYKSGLRAAFKPPRRIDLSQSSLDAKSSSPVPINRSVDSKVSQDKEPSPYRAASSELSRQAYKRPKTNSNVIKSEGSLSVSTPGPKDEESVKMYMVQWRKVTNKKNKTWDGDGLIVVTSSGITFKCDVKGNGNYKQMGKTLKTKTEGIIAVGSYELEIDYEITDKTTLNNSQDVGQENKVPLHHIPAPPRNQFKKVVPLGASNTQSTARVSTNNRNPLHDPGAEHSLVMTKPPNQKCEDTIDVVVDPVLSKLLRPHQREAVSFVYECLMGFKNFRGNGALLADEMGLGKTLTTITLIWTLLKQTPYSEDISPICKKVLITCPVTLIGNWKKEFKKWLNINRIGVLTVNNKQNASKDKQEIKSFGKTRIYQVLIMSYEKVLSCQNELSTIDFDMLVCDEGHRLKNSSNKVLKVLNDLNISKKILLTGTPIQNDLVEFYNIINFINPSVLGSFQSFQKDFIKPILRSREVNCINKDTIKRGEIKSNELIELTKEFTLRRTSSILSGYLTEKTDIILFCPPTELQIALFKFVLNSKRFNALLREDNFNNSLALITLFKKICNSPSLLFQDKLFNSLIENEQDSTIDLTTLSKKTASSKVNILIPLLIEINQIGDKTVLISNYTQTLDLLETILNKLNISFLRLDGSTPNKFRDKLVNDFNKQPLLTNSVFLLSAKSGGVGLNLIGASRLILFDNDWNPSIDLQAMARIHRDGQTKPVFIYRIMTTGCIDEKIFQRQMMKNNLSDKFLDNKTDSKLNLFDMNDLKDLFTVNEKTLSNTHDLLQCECAGIGEDINPLSIDIDDSDDTDEEINNPGGWITALDYKQEDQKPKKQQASMINALIEYKHYNPINVSEHLDCGDLVTKNIIQKSKEGSMPIPVTYMLTKVTNCTSV